MPTADGFDAFGLARRVLLYERKMVYGKRIAVCVEKSATAFFICGVMFRVGWKCAPENFAVAFFRFPKGLRRASVDSATLVEQPARADIK